VTRRTQFRLLVAFTIVWVGWTAWSLLGQSIPYQLRVVDDLGAPIAAAIIDAAGSQEGTTGEDGRVDLIWDNEVVLEVSAPGHVPQRLVLSEQPSGQVDVVLKALVLRGRVVDGDGEGVEGAIVQTGAAGATTDLQGNFQIRGAGEGEVTVRRAAWLPASFEWNGGTGDVVVEIEPFNARAVHIDGPSMRDDFDRFVDMAMETELNALMIDLKDETGFVWYDTENSTAIEVGADREAYDLEATVARADELGLYVIGRLVLFNDPIAAIAKPEIAVWDSVADIPYETNGQYFLDPTDPEARKYGMDLAVEACAVGVDEIQFDYVRFPDDRRDAATFDGGVGPEIRVTTISQFLTEAVETLRPMGCAVAADIFGYLTTATNDGGIGQRWEEIASAVDVVSPMLYPSHYHPEFFGFSSNERPGDVVRQALVDGMNRLPRNIVVRPWLQDFDYGARRVREQIESAEEFGLGWMLWNAESRVTVDALNPAE
jgi:hypothetical protein